MDSPVVEDARSWPDAPAIAGEHDPGLASTDVAKKRDPLIGRRLIDRHLNLVSGVNGEIVEYWCSVRHTWILFKPCIILLESVHAIGIDSSLQQWARVTTGGPLLAAYPHPNRGVAIGGIGAIHRGNCEVALDIRDECTAGWHDVTRPIV